MTEKKKADYMPPLETKKKMKIRKAKSNSTAGKTKGEACIARPIDKAFARRNRSHIDRLYPDWCEAMQKKLDKYK